MFNALRAAFLSLFLCGVACAQVSGPTTHTPTLTVSPGPTDVQDLTVNGTCTGCGGLPADPLPVANGGTGQIDVAEDQILVGDQGGSAYFFADLPDCPDDALGYDSSTGTINCNPLGGSGGPQFIIKASNETRNNTATVANDADFVWSSLAAGTYSLQCFLIVDNRTSGTPGFRLNANVSTGLVSDSAVHVTRNDSAGNGLSGLIVSAMNQDLTTTNNTNVVIAVNLFAGFGISSTADVRLKWAQSVANASDTTMYRGSWCRLE